MSTISHSHKHLRTCWSDVRALLQTRQYNALPPHLAAAFTTLIPPHFDLLLSYLYSAMRGRHAKPHLFSMLHDITDRYGHPEAIPFLIAANRAEQIKTLKLHKLPSSTLSSSALLPLVRYPELFTRTLDENIKALPSTWLLELFDYVTDRKLAQKILSAMLEDDGRRLLEVSSQKSLEFFDRNAERHLFFEEDSSRLFCTLHMLQATHRPAYYEALRTRLHAILSEPAMSRRALPSPLHDLLDVLGLTHLHMQPPHPAEGEGEEPTLAELARRMADSKTRAAVANLLTEHGLPIDELPKHVRVCVLTGFLHAPNLPSRQRLLSLLSKRLHHHEHGIARIDRKLLAVVRPWSEDGSNLSTPRGSHSRRKR